MFPVKNYAYVENSVFKLIFGVWGVDIGQHIFILCGTEGHPYARLGRQLPARCVFQCRHFQGMHEGNGVGQESDFCRF